ncbi:hypothetical protein I7I53_07730 [Histoplasma capsulatum var. duboisii H88]|uniref:Uncharacterized protein n=1 Tax=Ajellomyces capsulatus (strain H88) TaxID=544711 RepID=A0A8A1LI90_AJEC8|nr:hypothetical protein I7I53_07730 [Histoplasma capsulatum var. duboisii H88]
MAREGRGENQKSKTRKKKAKLFKQDSPSPCIGFVSLRYGRSCSYQGGRNFLSSAISAGVKKKKRKNEKTLGSKKKETISELQLHCSYGG